MILYPNLSDYDLFLMIKNTRDHYASAELYQRYWDLVRKAVVKVLPDETIIEDVVQDTFISFFESNIVPEKTFNFKGYISRIARNKAIDQIRNNKKTIKFLKILAEHANEVSPAVDAYVIDKEYEAIVDEVIDKMPERMKQIFIMSRKLYLDNDEIARQLKISQATVKKQLQLAMKRISLRLTLILKLYLIYILLQR